MEAFKTIVAVLQGYKTFACIIAGVLVETLEKERMISPDSAETYMVWIVGAGGASFVAKLNRWMQMGKQP